ncbi:MAG: ABC transporter ATP-binding protein [Deltaproteobacteria bacterium]|nr:ABC transporter ATP-binding protein [Deltaproteobacteria bacterium]
MIIAEHISKYYGAKVAVSDLTFSIKKGEVVGLLGRNGAGKTTILKILSGLLVPTAGRVRIADIDLRDNPESLRAQIGFLPDTPPLYPEMSVTDFLSFVARIKGLRGPINDNVEQALIAADLESVRNDRIDTLSQGFRRRVGIAQAVVNKPALVLLDEPTSSLDPAQVVHMRQLIRGLAHEHTIIVSSHLLSEIEKTCDRLLLLDQGKIIAEGSEQELARKISAAINVAIEVRGSKTALEQTLNNIADVKRHTILSDTNGIIQAKVELDHDIREELSSAVIKAGLGLRRIEGDHIELEDIFMSLTTTPNTDEVAK